MRISFKRRTVFRGERPESGKFPVVLQTIHTANDTLDKVDAKAAVKSLRTVEAAIRTLDN